MPLHFGMGVPWSTYSGENGKTATLRMASEHPQHLMIKTSNLRLLGQSSMAHHVFHDRRAGFFGDQLSQSIPEIIPDEHGLAFVGSDPLLRSFERKKNHGSTGFFDRPVSTTPFWLPSGTD